MFETLSKNLEKAIKSLKGEGRITEINIASTIKEIRRSLVQADVHYKVAKQVTDEIKQKAIGINLRFSRTTILSRLLLPKSCKNFCFIAVCALHKLNL